MAILSASLIWLAQCSMDFRVSLESIRQIHDACGRCLALSRQHAAGVTEEEITKMLDQYDTNKDGTIDYAEFQAMIRGNDVELQRAATFFRDRPITIPT